MDKKIRLDKLLSEHADRTRSQVRASIKNGMVRVNGSVIKEAGYKISAADRVSFDGQPVIYEEFSCYMLNKPIGCVSATKDNLSRTVLDLLKDVSTKKMFPVGRLDKDTEGLLLITDDGMLAHQLLSPKKHVEKTYYAILDDVLTEQNMEALKTGIEIGDEKPCLPAAVKKCGEETDRPEFQGISTQAYEITIVEGRFHQVKRMFAKCGRQVLYLKRISMGTLVLDRNLKPGEFRRLTETEERLLRTDHGKTE
ncbi:MAG TPA: pseudouridine synthase [Lachnospiraceae bacterium]|nr:pseudouridine synthase [Lachnospiraceae bacterium]